MCLISHPINSEARFISSLLGRERRVRMLARAAGSALGSLFVGLTLVAVAAIGVLGTLTSTTLEFQPRATS
jgi:hypothetical protein